MHATFNSFYRLLVDFWQDEATVEFIRHLEAAISHVGDDGAGSDSEYQVFQAKTNMIEACNSAVLPLEIRMMDAVVPAALLLPVEFAIWSKQHPVRTEDELRDQQHDIAGATVYCLRQIMLAIVHRADRSVLRDRLCHVAVRSIVTNLINSLLLRGELMTAENDLNLRLQRGMMTQIANAARAEMMALCATAGDEDVLASNESTLAELDTALAIGLMTSYQLVGTLADIRDNPPDAASANSSDNQHHQQPQSHHKPSFGATAAAVVAATAFAQNGATHRRKPSGSGAALRVSREKYERLLRKACVARAKCGDQRCIEYATEAAMAEFVAVSSPAQDAPAKKKK